MRQNGSDQRPPLRIGIAGAGIGGLAAATLLARAGHSVDICDQFEAPRPIGSGLVIQPVGLSVLDRVGVGTEARHLGRRIVRLLGHEATKGLRVLDVSYGGPEAGLAIHRASLFAILLQAAMNAGAQLHPGARVSEAPRNGKERVLRQTSGEDLGPFDLVIDAAGAGSPLSSLKARPLPYGAIWGTVPWREVPGLAPDLLTQRYRAANRMAGVLPIGTLPEGDRPLTAVFWSMSRGDLDTWEARPDMGWRDEAVALWPEAAAFFEAISGPEDMTIARYSHGTLARPYAPGLVHIGDAAHRTSPQLGQGANMALLDAAALSLALEQNAPEAALVAYARMRRWHVRLYQGVSRLFTPQYQSDSRLLPILRDRVLFPLSQVPPLPGVLSGLVSGALIPPLAGQAFD
ncbi:MAG: FAD-dependent monooxygenase [Rhodobacteraceae bacterium]|nr:FAD-dependent monooxygenase [Paracoccaceae bacterium]